MTPKKLKSNAKALVLGGGAARGFAHIGLLEVFEDEGIEFDLIVGTSMGALVGGVYAAGVAPAEIERAVVELPWRKLLAYFRPHMRGGGLSTGSAIRKALTALVGDVDIADLPIPFASVATDVVAGEKIVFASGHAVTAIRASISLPGTFRPVLLGGRTLVDGGVLEPVPVPTAREMGASTVVACNVIDHPSKDVFAGKWARVSDESKAAAPSRKKAAEKGGWYEQVAAMAQRLSHRRRKRREAKGLSPTMGRVLYNSFRIQQYSLGDYQSREADLVIEPHLGDVRAREFYRADECIEAGRLAAKEALPAVRALFKRG